jgi:hypothetical protein
MKLRPLIFATLIGTVAQVVGGSVINAVSYVPFHQSTDTGGLFEPLIPFVMFGLLLGVAGLIIDLMAGWLAGRWGGSVRDSVITGGLTQLVGGFVNGLVAVVVFYIAGQQTLPGPDSTVQGLAESYVGLLLLIAIGINVVGWLVGVLGGAIVSGIGGRVGVNVRPKG